MHAGWAAQSGMRAALLARAGFYGPRTVFEGVHGLFHGFANTLDGNYDEVIGDFGKRWVTETLAFKPYPCGTMAHPYIDCARRLGGEGARPTTSRRWSATWARGPCTGCGSRSPPSRSPPTAMPGNSRTPYCIAAGFVRGNVGLGRLHRRGGARSGGGRAGAARSATASIRTIPIRASFTGHIRATLNDGRVIEERQPHFRGGAQEPLTRADIEDKFVLNCRHGGWDEARAKRRSRCCASSTTAGSISRRCGGESSCAYRLDDRSRIDIHRVLTLLTQVGGVIFVTRRYSWAAGSCPKTLQGWRHARADHGDLSSFSIRRCSADRRSQRSRRPAGGFRCPAMPEAGRPFAAGSRLRIASSTATTSMRASVALMTEMSQARSIALHPRNDPRSTLTAIFPSSTDFRLLASPFAQLTARKLDMAYCLRSPDGDIPAGTACDRRSTTGHSSSWAPGDTSPSYTGDRLLSLRVETCELPATRSPPQPRHWSLRADRARRRDGWRTSGRDLGASSGYSSSLILPRALGVSSPTAAAFRAAGAASPRRPHNHWRFSRSTPCHAGNGTASGPRLRGDDSASDNAADHRRQSAYARPPMYTDLALHIDGAWLNGDGRAGEDVINPATEKPLGKLPHASTADLDRALEAARRASRSGATPPPMSAPRCCARPPTSCASAPTRSRAS